MGRGGAFCMVGRFDSASVETGGLLGCCRPFGGRIGDGIVPRRSGPANFDRRLVRSVWKHAYNGWADRESAAGPNPARACAKLQEARGISAAKAWRTVRRVCRRVFGHHIWLMSVAMVATATPSTMAVQPPTSPTKLARKLDCEHA